MIRKKNKNSKGTISFEDVEASDVEFSAVSSFPSRGILVYMKPRTAAFSLLKVNLTLKVVGNEKKGGLRFLQLLGISLGPWRYMSIFILNVPFAIEKCISVSACSSKMNRRIV